MRKELLGPHGTYNLRQLGNPSVAHTRGIKERQVGGDQRARVA
jgi:hypothetical protein